MTPIRTLLVDDHQMVRQGLVFFLSTQEDIDVVGQASDGEEAGRLAALTHPASSIDALTRFTRGLGYNG